MDRHLLSQAADSAVASGRFLFVVLLFRTKDDRIILTLSKGVAEMNLKLIVVIGVVLITNLFCFFLMRVFCNT